MQTVSLSVDQLLPPVVVMRDDMDPESFGELVADVRAHGLEQPLIVTPLGDRFRIVAGYRRWRAAQDAGLLEVPCVIKTLDEGGELRTMLRENLHRENPSPLEEGKMFATMYEGLHLTVEGIAVEVGKSPAYVGARIFLVQGPADIREALRLSHITFTVALELMRVTHDADRAYLLHWAITGGATGAIVHGWVQERLKARAMTPDAPAPATAATAFGAPPVIMGICEWHRGQVPLDGVLSIRVCGSCYGQLEMIRQRLEEQTRTQEGGETDVPRA